MSRVTTSGAATVYRKLSGRYRCLILRPSKGIRLAIPGVTTRTGPADLRRSKTTMDEPTDMTHGMPELERSDTLLQVVRALRQQWRSPCDSETSGCVQGHGAAGLHRNVRRIFRPNHPKLTGNARSCSSNRHLT
jgi:hypothetical protein